MKLVFAKSGIFARKSQKGFTLLELLVVITLLAILSVGALVAYEGIGENAQNVGAANNIAVSDSAIRSYAALEGEYPSQWDNLANLNDGSVNQFIADPTRRVITAFDLAAVPAAPRASVVNALVNAGLDEFQSLTSAATFGEAAVPNEVWNESALGVATPADELELTYVAAVPGTPASATLSYDGAAPTNAFLSAFASGSTSGCTVGSGTGAPSLATPKLGTALTNSNALNRINDVLDSDVCHLVVAVGFGKDVPGTTLNSKVAISTAPTYVSDNINPSEDYARYIALFHVGSGDTSDGASSAAKAAISEFRNKAKLIAIVDTEGRAIDQAISGAFQEENE